MPGIACGYSKQSQNPSKNLRADMDWYSSLLHVLMRENKVGDIDLGQVFSVSILWMDGL